MGQAPHYRGRARHGRPTLQPAPPFPPPVAAGPVAYAGAMSGNHMIHVHIDTQSPRWSTGHYRFEQHYHFSVSSEQDVQYALGRLAELCDELRNPPRDGIPSQDAPPTGPVDE